MKALYKLEVFPAGLPSLCTDVGQHIDDNTGKQMKSDICAEFTTYLESFPWGTNPFGKVSAPDKRRKTAEIINKVAGDFNAKHLSLIESSCMRTGMYLTIDESDLSKMVPVKYLSFAHP